MLRLELEIGMVEGSIAVKDLPEGVLKERLLRSRMGLAVPLTAGTRVDGLLAVGERASGVRPYATVTSLDR